VFVQGTAVAVLGGLEPHPAFLPTWSLTVEWTFYLIFPFALRLISRLFPSRYVWRGLASVALLLYAIALPLSFVAFYFLPVANLGVMFAGASLAAGLANRTSPMRSDTGYTMLAMATLALLAITPGFTLGWAWKLAVMPSAAIAALVVINAVMAGNPATRLLSWPPLKIAGLAAYSLYLWHMAIAWIVWVNTPGVSKWVQALVAVGSIALVTTISFWLLERPVLSCGAMTRPRELEPSRSGQAE
jgi:peptidoglycan/LPS O-acetylase OafA/YrhL